MRPASLLFILLPLLLTGCATGLLYSDTRTPLVKNMSRTPRGVLLAQVDSKEIREPITAARISATWDSKAIGDAAKQAGLETIYYADLEVFSLLLGIWKQETVRVWGAGAEGPSSVSLKPQ